MAAAADVLKGALPRDDLAVLDISALNRTASPVLLAMCAFPGHMHARWVQCRLSPAMAGTFMLSSRSTSAPHMATHCCCRQLLEGPGSGSQDSGPARSTGSNPQDAPASAIGRTAVAPEGAQTRQPSCPVCGKTPMQARVCSCFAFTKCMLEPLMRLWSCCEGWVVPWAR